ncbi:MAG: nucleotidyltransferase domain-containing protein [Planctomycetes bacterium]|nr:nucleotidyltransferase domain-containing protein [Planctomycetota bacterium]
MRFQEQPCEPKALGAADVEDLVQRLESFCAGTDIVLLYLHGAHARGTQGALSDLDLAVLLAPTARRSFDARLELVARLEEVSRRDDVDIVVLNDAGVIISDRVVRSGRLVFARSEREKVRFEDHAIKAALDFQHFSREYDEALFRELSEGKIRGRS